MSDPFIADMERAKGCVRPRGLPQRGAKRHTVPPPVQVQILDQEPPEELTQAERLAYPKCALVTGEDKLQQLLASAYAQYLIRLEVKR